jgi:sugar phosphate isomerase/epimerase
MRNLPVGLQLFSVRKTMEKDARIGYKEIEFAIFPYNNGEFEPGMPARELKAKLADIGLHVVNTMVAFHDKLNWNKIIEYCAELGSLGFCSPIFFYKNKDAIFERADWLNKMGEKSLKSGLEFYFHNHFMEFQKFDGQYAFDLILQHTDPASVYIELDTFWAQRGGMEPVALMDHIGDRLRLLHQKDISRLARPVNLYEVIPEGTSITYDVFYPLGSSVLDFTEVGTGIMDIRGIVKKALAMNSIKRLIIEQDQTTLAELDSVKIGFDCLTRIIKELNA